MNKIEFIEAVAKKANVSKSDVKKVLEATVCTVKSALKKEGDALKLAGLGTLTVKKRKARKGINPKTGEEIKILAKKYVAFKAAKALKEKL